MHVEIQCFGAMRDYLPDGTVGNSASIELPAEARVADAARALAAPETLIHAVLVNEDPADLSTLLRDGDRLTLMPHYSGGRT